MMDISHSFPTFLPHFIVLFRLHIRWIIVDSLRNRMIKVERFINVGMWEMWERLCKRIEKVYTEGWR